MFIRMNVCRGKFSIERIFLWVKIFSSKRSFKQLSIVIRSGKCLFKQLFIQTRNIFSYREMFDERKIYHNLYINNELITNFNFVNINLMWVFIYIKYYINTIIIPQMRITHRVTLFITINLFVSFFLLIWF